MDISEERLISLILQNRRDLTREQLELLIEEKIDELRISRKTALYLIMIELGISTSSPIEKRIRFNELTDGLSNINIVGRLLWLKPTEEYEGVIVTRGGIMDESMILPILFWGRRKEEILSQNLYEGGIIEISGAYTKSSLSGGIEIHVPVRAKIENYRGSIEIPEPYDILVSLDQDISRYQVINTFGRVLSTPRERIVMVGENEIRVATFLLGYKDSFKRVVMWRNIIDEYKWLESGKTIIIYLARVKINKFGETEIHLSRNSYVVEESSLDVPIIVKDEKLANVQPGLNLARVKATLLARGALKIDLEKKREVRSVLIADETREATLVLMGEKARLIDEIKEGDVVAIKIFRASIKGDSLIIFVDEASTIERIEKETITPVIHVATKSIDELSIEDKIVNIKGKIVKGPVKTDDYSDLSFFLAEDETGKPFKILFRGDIKDYTDDEINQGDKVLIKAGLVDLYPLLMKKDMPTIKLRAYSYIEKIY